MASPEICLPRVYSAEDQPPPRAEIENKIPEKRPDGDSLSSRSNHDGEFVWRYLTFETELPTPAYLLQPLNQQNNRNPVPECPNLKKYTSPFLWSEGRKSFMTWLSCTATVFTGYNAGAYSSGISQMMEEWNISRVAALVGITMFTCGFGIAPMFLAPFSEINGRRPVFVATGLLWVVFQIVCGVTPTFSGMLINRFLSGCASSTFSTMVGGVVSDIYHAKDRNTAMALFSGAAIMGTSLGPLVSGFIAQNTTWRWIFYLQIIIDGLLMVVVIFTFQETRGSVLLSQKAKALNKYYSQLEAAGYPGLLTPPSTNPPNPQRIRWKCKSDEERGSITTMIKISLWRPFHMLFTEPVVFFFSIWVSFSWGVLFLTFSAVPLIFQTTYSFTLQQASSIFAASVAATILFTLLAIFQEPLLLASPRLPASHRAILASPEGRLYFACLESALLPLGCLWFGISGAYPQVHWIVPALGIGCAAIGVFSVYLAVFNYLADCYHRYASSALAAQSFCRNLLGGVFPLFTTQMFHAMTFQGAGAFLGGLGFLLTAVPWVLLLYGPQIRARSKLASEIMGSKD